MFLSQEVRIHGHVTVSMEEMQYHVLLVRKYLRSVVLIMEKLLEVHHPISVRLVRHEQFQDQVHGLGHVLEQMEERQYHVKQKKNLHQLCVIRHSMIL